MSTTVRTPDRTYDADDLLPLVEIGPALHYARTTAHMWVARNADFPPPVIDRTKARLYSLTEVRAWLAAR